MQVDHSASITWNSDGNRTEIGSATDNRTVAKRSKLRKPKEGRNLVARAAQTRNSAGPMKDKRKLSRQQEKLRTRRESERAN